MNQLNLKKPQGRGLGAAEEKMSLCIYLCLDCTEWERSSEMEVCAVCEVDVTSRQAGGQGSILFHLHVY